MPGDFASPLKNPVSPGGPAWMSPMAYAWLVVALLVPVALLNYLDRQMLATMKESMMFDIPDIKTKENWGFILGSFKWVYALLSPIGGYIADRVSRRHVIAISLFVWSAVTYATGQVTTFEQLIITRALMGISEAFYIPTALALITDFHVGPTRSRAVGVHQMGIYAGLILGGFAGFVASEPSLGWRWAFGVCGAIGIIYAIPLFLILRNPQRQMNQQATGLSPIAAARELVTNVGFLLLVLYFTLPAMAGWVVKDWMPDIINEKFQLGQGPSGMVAVMGPQFGSILGVLFAGWLADRWMRTSIRGRINVSAIGMIMFLPALYGVGTTSLLWMAIGYLILFGVGWGFFDCNNMPILCQIVRPELRATGYGIMNLVSISFGGFADWKFGALRDENVPLSVIFGVFAGIALLSVAIVLMIRPREIKG